MIDIGAGVAMPATPNVSGGSDPGIKSSATADDAGGAQQFADLLRQPEQAPASWDRTERLLPQLRAGVEVLNRLLVPAGMTGDPSGNAAAGAQDSLLGEPAAGDSTSSDDVDLDQLMLSAMIDASPGMVQLPMAPRKEQVEAPVSDQAASVHGGIRPMTSELGFAPSAVPTGVPMVARVTAIGSHFAPAGLPLVGNAQPVLSERVATFARAVGITSWASEDTAVKVDEIVTGEGTVDATGNVAASMPDAPSTMSIPAPRSADRQAPILLTATGTGAPMRTMPAAPEPSVGAVERTLIGQVSPASTTRVREQTIASDTVSQIGAAVLRSLDLSPDTSPARELAASPFPATGVTTTAVPTLLRHLTVELHPADLGRVSVELRLAEGRLGVALRAESSATAGLIDGQLAELGGRLADAGYAIDSLSVGRLTDGGDRSIVAFDDATTRDVASDRGASGPATGGGDGKSGARRDDPRSDPPATSAKGGNRPSDDQRNRSQPGVFV